MEIENNSLTLQLGDIVEFIDKTNITLNDHLFYIDYIDDSLITLIETKKKYSIDLILENGSIMNEKIEEIHLLSRSEHSGYATQRDLIPENWVNVFFDGDVPFVITGVITDLEEDMIEIKTLQNEVIYINFAYKGIPKDLPISRIEIRNKPATERNIDGEPEKEYVDEQPFPEESQNSANDNEDDERKLKRDHTLQDGDIIFGKEYLAPIVQYVELDESKHRYSLDEQIGSLIDEILSEIPTYKREEIMNEVFVQTERFKQLRNQFSREDAFGNLIPDVKSALYKPLGVFFEKFNHRIPWILPVVKNLKKIYVTKEEEDNGSVEEESDHVKISMINDLSEISDLVESYKETGGYYTLYENLNVYFNPGESVLDENKQDIIQEIYPSISTEVINNDLNDLVSRTFSHKNIGEKSFCLSRCTTPLNKLIRKEGTVGSQHITTQLTKPDLMSIDSFLFLPRPVMDISRMFLNSSSILEKTQLSHISFQYSDLFRSHVGVEKYIIDETTDDEGYKRIENSLMSNKIKHIVFKNMGVRDKETYLRNVSKCIPKTKALFSIMRENIRDALTISEVLHFMEPFLVYSDDLSYLQYKNITGYLRFRIKEFNKELAESIHQFSELNAHRDTQSYRERKQTFELLPLLTDKNNLRDFIQKDYNLQTADSISEVLHKIVKIDDGMLFFGAIMNETKLLMFPEPFTNLLEEDAANIKDKGSGVKNTCPTITIAKLYATKQELVLDDNKMIFFDKKYDKTDYSVLDKYEQELLNKTTTDFKDFIFQKIKNTKKGMSDVDIWSLIETLLSGHKKVNDGHGAILNEGPYSEDSSYEYYTRKNNKWTKNETNIGINVNEDNVLCNIKKDCVYDFNMQNCENIEKNKFQLKENLLKQVIDEFDANYFQSKERYEKWLDDRNEFINTKYFPSLRRVLMFNKFRYNMNQMSLSSIGDTILSNITSSPYHSILKEILGIEDFIRKQKFIIKFKAKCLRGALPENVVNLEGTFESEHWLYCNVTSIPMLPTFRYDIAFNYLKNIYNTDAYDLFMDGLIAKIGKKSDNGDSWVDIHSGQFIKYDNFDTDEGYDESGFRIQTRNSLEKDVGMQIGQITQFKTKELKIINIIIVSLVKNMGIHFDGQPVMNWVVEVLSSQMQNPDEYKENTKKQKFIPDYKDYYNTNVLYFTIGALLIGIQTQVPSVKVKSKSSPNCVKSFSGFPLEGTGDMSGVNYIACVTHKMKVSYEPWNVLLKVKETTVASRIQAAIGILLKEHDVQQAIRTKEEYILQQKDVANVPVENDISRWKTFLPPLCSLELSTVKDISFDFKTKLHASMKSSDNNQVEDILVLQTKQILYSFGIQGELQKMVKSKERIFQNMLENACCTHSPNETTFNSTSNKNIIDYNARSYEIENILSDIKHYSASSMFLSKIKTKNVYPTLNTGLDEKTIYLAFIHYCNLRSDQDIDEAFKSFFSEKPGYIHKNDSANEIIFKLKNDDRKFTEDMFHKMMKIVGQKNAVKLVLDNSSHSSKKHFQSKLESNPPNNNDELVELLKTVTDTFDIGTLTISDGTRKLKTYLNKSNDVMEKKIMDFLKENNPSMKKKERKKLISCVAELSDWKRSDNISGLTDDVTYKMILFYKTWTRNFATLFPNIILNGVDYSNVKTPTHWLLSVNHGKEIKKEINDYYESLKHFYDNKDLKEILIKIQEKTGFIVELDECTIMYSTIHRKDGKDIIPIFDEDTSQFLFKHYMFLILTMYVEHSYDTNTSQHVATLLTSYLQMMCKSKDMINYSYKEIQDKSFRLKEKEKNVMRDRLEGLTDEQREADTNLKINKLGVYNAGLQKGLTVYDKKTYENEREFRNKVNDEEEPEYYMNDNDEVNNVDDEINEDVLRIQNNGKDTITQLEEMDEYMSNEYIEHDAFDMSEEYGGQYENEDD